MKRFDIRLKKPGPGELPGPLLAEVFVKYYGEKDGLIFLGNECRTYAEFEALIESLINDLESLKKIAKQRFENQH